MDTLYQIVQKQSIKAQIPVNHKVDVWHRQKEPDGNRGTIIIKKGGLIG